MKITVYTTNTCAYCKILKQYLDSKSLEYEEVNLDDHPERRAEAIRMTGSMTVPVTHVVRKKGEYAISGWNLQKLAPVLTEE